MPTLLITTKNLLLPWSTKGPIRVGRLSSAAVKESTHHKVRVLSWRSKPCRNILADRPRRTGLACWDVIQFAALTCGWRAAKSLRRVQWQMTGPCCVAFRGALSWLFEQRATCLVSGLLGNFWGFLWFRTWSCCSGIDNGALHRLLCLVWGK